MIAWGREDYNDINSEMDDEDSSREVGRVDGGGIKVVDGALSPLRFRKVGLGAGRNTLEGGRIAFNAPPVPGMRENRAAQNHPPVALTVRLTPGSRLTGGPFHSGFLVHFSSASV
jgi:hypothetical protein